MSSHFKLRAFWANEKNFKFGELTQYASEKKYSITHVNNKHHGTKLKIYNGFEKTKKCREHKYRNFQKTKH